MKPTYDELVDALRDVVNDFENEGCEGCGTISAKVYNVAEALVARVNGLAPSPIDEMTEEDREDEAKNG